jgi:hypothetical protein
VIRWLTFIENGQPGTSGRQACQTRRRRSLDGQTQAHTLYVSEPEWQYPGLRSGRPVNWPAETWHKDYFPRDADDDAYAEARPYADSDQDR